MNDQEQPTSGLESSGSPADHEEPVVQPESGSATSASPPEPSQAEAAPPGDPDGVAGDEALPRQEEGEVGGDPTATQGPAIPLDEAPALDDYYWEIRIHAEDPKPFLVPLPANEVHRIKEVFAPPPDFDRWARKHGDLRRVYLVHGHEHAGKLTCAVGLALELLDGNPEGASFLRYRRRAAGSPQLDAFLLSAEAARCSKESTRQIVYIAEDCFADRLIDPAVLASSLDELEGRLSDLGAYLILCAEQVPSEVIGPHIESVSAENVDLGKVLENHLRRYQSGAESVRIDQEIAATAARLWQNSLSGKLRFPAQVRGFCHGLGELGFHASEREIGKVADLAARIGQLRVRTWFQKLTANQKLFALLAHLFQGLERRDLDLIYGAAVRHLRSSGIEGLEDPRQTGYDDLLQAVHARLEETTSLEVQGPLSRVASAPGAGDEADGEATGADGGEMGTDTLTDEPELQQIVVFTDRALHDELRRQVRSHAALLWSLRPLFEGLASERQTPADWRFRKTLGTAVGQLGAADRDQMTGLLEVLAVNRSSGVIAVAGAALGQSLASEPSSQARGMQLLRSWIENPDPRLSWAASLAIWRAYYGVLEARADGQDLRQVTDLLERLLELLEALVKRCGARSRQLQRATGERGRPSARARAQHARAHQQWRKAWRECIEGATYALFMTAQADLQTTAPLIQRWLGEDSQTDLPEVAVNAAVEVFRVAGRRKPSAETLAALQKLLLPLLAYEQLAIEQLAPVMRTLRGWHRFDDLRELWWQGLVYAANRCVEGAARRFSHAVVRFWLEEPGGSSDLSRYGQALLARILAMDGSPAAIPGRERGVILLDMAGRGELASIAERGRRLYWLLQALVDTEVRHLGTTTPLVNPGESAPYRRLAGAARPRLLVPAVEALGRLPAFVLVLASGEILDLEDALCQPWAGRLIVAGPAEATERRRGQDRASDVQTVELEWHQGDESLMRIVEVVVAHRFRAVGGDDAETLGAWLQAQHGLPAESTEVLWRRLEAWAEELDIARFDSRDDPSRRLLCAIHWRAKTEPAECVERLLAWSKGTSGELVGLMARAATRMLFTMIGSGGWHPPRSSHGRLFELAELIAETRRGVEVVLAAARELIEDDEWRRFLCACDGGILLAWLKQVPVELRAHLREHAEEWITRAPGDNVPQAARAVLEEIHRLAQVGYIHELPDLTQGGSYRVLVLDADDESPKQRQRAAQLAAGVLNRSRDAASPWLVFRLGRSAPLELGHEKVTPEALLASPARPRLLHPLLDTLSPDTVKLVLLLVTAPPLDANDLADSAWLPKVHCHVTDPRWRHGTPLARVPAAAESNDPAPFLSYLATVDDSEGRSREEATWS